MNNWAYFMPVKNKDFIIKIADKVRQYKEVSINKTPFGWQLKIKLK